MQTVLTVAGPAVEPVTVDDLKSFARIDGDGEDSENDLLETFIGMAREAAENYTRRSFITRTLKLSLDNAGYGRSEWMPGFYNLPVGYFDGSLSSTLELPRGPVLSVTSITSYDTLNASTLYDDTKYSLFGDRVALNSGESWPSGLRSINAAEIVYTAGYGPAATDVPRPIRVAIMIHAGLLYETRGLCESDCPPAGIQLLRPYRVEGL